MKREYHAPIPQVSIITPAFNRAHLLEETIESVLNQDYIPLEYIVLDDGSTDGTLDVIKKYGDRLRWESHPNMGESRTVNRGFSLARGDIICVVNSDDPLLPGAIRRAVDYLGDNPEVMVAYPDWVLIDKSGRKLQQISVHEYTGAADMIRRHHCLPGPGTYFRRRIIEEIGGRNPSYRFVSDLDFWFRASLVGRFGRIPETLATFRMHEGSTTVKSRGLEVAEEHIRLIDEFYSRDDLPPGIEEVKDEAYSSAFFIGGCVLSAASLLPKLGYFTRALTYAPRKYLGEYRMRLAMMLFSLFGVSQMGAQKTYLLVKHYLS